MSAMDYQRVQCPYCGEQDYVEDCSVCCRPIEVRLCRDGDCWRLEVRRDDD
jgi:predicted amidophosphoribosyltransferase